MTFGFGLVILATSTLASTSTSRVKYVGKQVDVHKGKDLTAHISISEIRPRDHLYAVGPLEQLEGEITVIDGKIFVSSFEQDSLAIKEAPDAKAIFLVYADVPAWEQSKLSGTLNMDALETATAEQARKAGRYSDEAFPFLVTGKAARIQLHVVNKKQDAPLSPGMEKERIPIDLSNQEVQLIGFYSTRHKGIFTHHDRNSHIHVRTMDNQYVGHLDAIELTNATLFLPLQKK